MFTVNVRRLIYACDKILVRNLRARKPERKVINPGVDHRLQAFQQEGIQLQDDDAEEFMEQSESSFYNVGETYNEHLNETLIGKHDLRHHIVKERYFKENMPNLLTWSEKEQIRHLALTQPDEWTPQRIAESFPVTEQVVKKLLKYPWKPATEERITRHDASAMRNWRELKEGTLDIPDEIKDHFLKFSQRTIPPLNKKSVKIDISQEKVGEFEQIVRRCANKEQSNDEMDAENETTDIKQPKQKIDYKRVTLDELASKIKTRLDHGQNVDISEKIMVDSIAAVPSKNDKALKVNKEIDLIPEKEPNMLTGFKESDKVIGYPERIRIPKQAYKKGATYKMNDCFYDHDGRFLYRVIGMTESNH